jgi:hypothetical protein
MATVRDAVAQALEATAGQPVEVQAAAVAAAMPAPPSNEVGWLWKALIAGLIAVLVLALGGVLVAVLDGKDSTSPDVIVTLFTAVLTGLIGLFVKSPVQG